MNLKLFKLLKMSQERVWNWLSCFLPFGVTQRFRDICDFQFENTEIQFKPDWHNVTPHLVWFDLTWLTCNDDDWTARTVAVKILVDWNPVQTGLTQLDSCTLLGFQHYNALPSWLCKTIHLTKQKNTFESKKCSKSTNWIYAAHCLVSNFFFVSWTKTFCNLDK